MKKFGGLLKGDTVGVELAYSFEVWRVKNIRGWVDSIGGENDNLQLHVLVEFENGEKEVFLKTDSISGTMIKKFIADKKEFESKLKFNINKLHKLIDEMWDEEETVF